MVRSQNFDLQVPTSLEKGIKDYAIVGLLLAITLELFWESALFYNIKGLFRIMI